MSKPTLDDTRWATTAGDVDSVELTSPPSGLKDDGYTPSNLIPDHRHWNYWHNRAYRWFQYLNSGNFEGASTFASTLVVAGATSVGAPRVIPDLVFTADATSNACTSTAHGLVTGDGPVRTSNSGGALPGGLAIATNYWIIKTGADTFKLATTLANALALTPIDLTTNGTGTQTLSDTVDTRRSANLSVAGNLEVLGSCGNLSAAFLTVGGLTAGLITVGSITATGDYFHTSEHKLPMSPMAFRPQTSATVTLDDRSAGGTPEGWTGWTSGAKIIAWIPLRAQDVITTITYDYDKVGSSANLTFEVLQHAVPLFGSTLLTVVDSFTDTSSGTGLVSHTTGALGVDVGNIITGSAYAIRVSSNTSSHFFLRALVRYTH